MTTKAVDLVVKVGGSCLRSPSVLDRVLSVMDRSHSAGARFAVVPGGGPFADVVRELARSTSSSDDAAHWMAILAMDQFAQIIADRLDSGVMVSERGAVIDAIERGAMPVLAPYLWLRSADPLPHGWDVTSDSIAAWVAGELGARRLVLVKPIAGEPGALCDPRFGSTLPSSVTARVVAAADEAGLRAALGG